MSNTLRYNNTIPGNIYYSNNKVQNVYYNNVKVWSAIPLSGTLSVGNTVTFDNKSWIVVHNSGNQWYLATSDIIELIEFGSSDNYNNSTLANRCVSWMNENLSVTAQAYMQNVTVNGVTAKVFVPSFGQVNGGFSYYNSNSRRICNLNGLAYYWWTSNKLYGNADYVGADGTLYSDTGWNIKKGFRPHICIQV